MREFFKQIGVVEDGKCVRLSNRFDELTIEEKKMAILSGIKLNPDAELTPSRVWSYLNKYLLNKLHMEKYEKLIIEWAKERGITNPENSRNQLLKTFEEMGEVSRAVLKNDRLGLIDGIGDVMVTLIILAEINDLDLEMCLSHAWNEIKNRTGKTVNGVFIKN